MKKQIVMASLGAIVAGSAILSGAIASPSSPFSAYEAIGYHAEATRNPVARLGEQLKTGALTLQHDSERGYLPALLEALNIDPSSQVLVYSKTSLQHPWINARTPRALYFNDETYIGWVQGTDIIEITTMDDEKGIVFYVFHNRPDARSKVERKTNACLNCHDTYGNMGGGVPEHMAGSSLVGTGGNRLSEAYGVSEVTDRTPIADRWGGWYVTGQHGSETHLGNILINDLSDFTGLDDVRRGNINSLDELDFLDTRPYLRDTSDIVALMVLEHQITVQNELTYVKFKAPVVLARMGHAEAAEAENWEDLPEDARRLLSRMMDKLVAALLFDGAAGLSDRISGTPDYQEWFLAQGPKDSQGRSLRALDLEKKFFMYPLSYLIQSSDFHTLPGYAKDYVYRRIAEALNEARDGWSQAERLAALDILAATQPEFTAYLAQ